MIAGSCRNIPLRKDRSSFNVTAGDSTGDWSRVQHPAHRDLDPATHRSETRLRVANGLFATRFLPT